MENLGWVKFHRKLKNASFYKRSTVVHLFVHLLLSANQQKRAFYWNGKEIQIEAGQLITGRDELSKQTGITPQSIRTALTILKSTSTITIKSTNRFSLISIPKWQEYQIQLTSRITSKLTNNQPTTNQQLTTNKNDKNEKNDKNKNTLENPKIKNKQMTFIGDIINKKTGISTEWQDRAFRYAKELKIDLRDNALKIRWLSLFKNGNANRLQKTYSYLSDYAPFTSMASCEDRIKYYFWYYANKT